MAEPFQTKPEGGSGGAKEPERPADKQSFSSPSSDSPNAEPHPVEDLRQAPVPQVEELLAKKSPARLPDGQVMSSEPVSPGFQQPADQSTSQPENQPAGPVEELLKIDEMKTLSYSDAATLAEKLEQLRKQPRETTSNLEIRN